MQFFDTKEEVIDIQLTPYGKHLLSKGLWKPVYYEFYDDDIVYDSEYAGITEGQEKIQERVKNTKRTKSQYAFKSPDTGSFLSQESSIEKRKSIHTNFLPLGNSSLIQQKYPAIQIRLLSGEINGITGSTSISGLPNNLKIIDTKDSIYTITNNNVENVEDISNIQKIYDDGSFIELQESELFLEINETGTDISIDNFEISLMEIDDDGNEIRKIYFIDEQKPTKVINNILVDNEDYETYNEMVLSEKFDNKKFINHFFDISTDKEIEQNILCKYLSKEEILRLKIVEGYDIDCVDDGNITTILATNPTALITEEET